MWSNRVDLADRPKAPTSLRRTAAPPTEELVAAVAALQDTNRRLVEQIRFQARFVTGGGGDVGA